MITQAIDVSQIFSAKIKSYHPPKEITPQQIIDVACEYFQIPPDSLMSNCRAGRLPICRHMIYKMIRRHVKPRVSLYAIGQMFNRDHTTVIHGIKTLEGWIETDDNVRHHVKEIEKQIFYGNE